MRLINTETLKVEEFLSDEAPIYAILSHRWQGKELTFHDLVDYTISSRKSEHRESVKKIKNFCRTAQRRHIDYAWVDTCCIDKTSSADLSEAINAMFEWYRRSVTCFVYLFDVEINSHGATNVSQSQWFSRGWTLQELLAPKEIVFYDCNWRMIGSRGLLYDQISKRTGIAKEHLRNFRAASIAQKMSWASKRETARAEDMAYCLLGIFEVNLPLIYGEGHRRAFRRLQLEILRQSDDETIFAWKASDNEKRGLLAESVHCFSESGTILALRGERKPYEMTNKGLRIELQLGLPPLTDHRQYIGNERSFAILAKLNCLQWESYMTLGLRLMVSFTTLERLHDPESVLRDIVLVGVPQCSRDQTELPVLFRHLDGRPEIGFDDAGLITVVREIYIES